MASQVVMICFFKPTVNIIIIIVGKSSDYTLKCDKKDKLVGIRICSEGARKSKSTERVLHQVFAHSNFDYL